jgi:hypothetical protein
MYFNNSSLVPTSAEPRQSARKTKSGDFPLRNPRGWISKEVLGLLQISQTLLELFTEDLRALIESRILNGNRRGNREGFSKT